MGKPVPQLLTEADLIALMEKHGHWSVAGRHGNWYFLAEGGCLFLRTL